MPYAIRALGEDLLAFTQTAATPKTLLLTGATGFLGGHFLFWKIRQPCRVFALVRGESAAQARARLLASLRAVAASYKLPVPEAELADRLVVILGDMTHPQGGVSAADRQTLLAAGIDEFWHCAASLKFEDRHREEIHLHNIAGTGNVLALAQQIGARRYLHISTAYSAGKLSGDIPEALHPLDIEYNNYYEESKNHAEHKVAGFCAMHGIDYRILRPSIIMGPLATHYSGGTRFGLYGFARELFRLRATLSQIEQPLRLIGAADAVCNLAPVDQCVLDMLTLSRDDFGEQRIFHLSNASDLSMPETIARVDRHVGTSCLQVVPARRSETSPLEQLFDRRTRFYGGYYQTRKRFLRRAPAQQAVAWSDLDAYLSAYLQELNAQETGESGFERIQVSSRDGLDLCVYRYGDAGLPPLVLVNAFGMPAEFMLPMAQRLATQYQVVTWESRWVPTLSHPFEPEQCDSLRHVNDLVDIMQFLGLRQVPLAGWSSGAQVVLRALAAYPDRFDCGVLLNPGVSLGPSAAMRITRFEHGIRALFPKIAANYRIAEKYCELIYGARNGSAEEMGTLTSILTSTDAYLLYMTSLPFRSPQSLYRYANMMSRMFAERDDAWCADVRQPVLVYVGGEDLITHPDVGDALRHRLSHGQLHCDADGDHFSHYYDAGVAALVGQFAAEHARAAPDEVAHA
jgi:thioester reductase-like protein/pimeloyl-ACP methyl ester carboxylesterase